MSGKDSTLNISPPDFTLVNNCNSPPLSIRLAAAQRWLCRPCKGLASVARVQAGRWMQVTSQPDALQRCVAARQDVSHGFMRQVRTQSNEQAKAWLPTWLPAVPDVVIQPLESKHAAQGCLLAGGCLSATEVANEVDSVSRAMPPTAVIL